MNVPASDSPPENQPPGIPSPRLGGVLPPRRGLQIFFFHSLALALTGVMALFFADLLWRTGWSGSRTALLILFVVLFFFSAIGSLNAIFGFVLRRAGENRHSPTLGDFHDQDIRQATTAIVVPVCNEEVTRVFEGLRTTYESLARTGHLEQFDFFVLSDSTRPANWVEEEKQWYQTLRDLGAPGWIYYRHRVSNEAKKSGNIRDFLRAWGRRYRYFLILDADSVMLGHTLVDLVKMMEANPRVGLIQTVPELVNAESLFGRMQQFANRLYSPIFATGMDYWSRGFGNYWGHNAIIRTAPFMRHCDLPRLPGRKPFGGHILSHDFVEAALLLKANWQVWLVPGLDGSYEEAPQGMIENAQRDRRWCQGNLQHGLVLFARGLRGISRWHLLQGIFGYLTGPIWFAFLMIFLSMRVMQQATGLSQITVHSWTRLLNLTADQEAGLIFTLCLGILLLPRLLAWIDLAMDQRRKAAFSGMGRVMVGTVFRTLFSTLHAPLQMLWQLQFVITILLGINVGWKPQTRVADGASWGFAVRHHWGHTLIGVIWGAAVLRLAPSTFWWFTPVLAGLLLAIPLSVLTSRRSWGARARNAGLFLTPEETSPPAELTALRRRMVKKAEFEENRPVSDMMEVVLDPYTNAIHVSLLRENALNPEYASALARLGVGTPAVQPLGEKLLAKGADALNATERILIMSDADILSWLHRQVWLRPGENVAPAWKIGMAPYAN